LTKKAFLPPLGPYHIEQLDSSSGLVGANNTKGRPTFIIGYLILLFRKKFCSLQITKNEKQEVKILPNTLAHLEARNNQHWPTFAVSCVPPATKMYVDLTNVKSVMLACVYFPCIRDYHTNWI
jgi:hypothetical protein